MATIELVGTIKSVGAIEHPSATFQKRDIIMVIDEDTKYPQPVSVQAVQGNCAKVDELRPGDKATLTCNLRGNEYKDKVYISLQLWKFTINQTTAGAPVQQAPPTYAAPPAGAVDDTSDLPF